MRLNVFYNIVLFCLALCFKLSAVIDLERTSQDFVLEIKKIHIPGYPHAYNPSIIRFQDSLLLSFRNAPHPQSYFDSLIGLIWLDEDLNPISAPQILNAQGNSQVFPRTEDARLLWVGDKLYMVYSGNKDPLISKKEFRVYLAELNFNGHIFFWDNIEGLFEFQGKNKKKGEKNWVPFDYNGRLLLAYSLAPHLILHPLLGQNACEIFSLSDETVSWDWGELRGGTPALSIDDGQYLAFFHSAQEMASIQSEEKMMLHYFMGAYMFSPEPPFAITQISPEPIVANGFYSGPVYKSSQKPARVVFPGGYIFNEDYIWIAYGRQDQEVWILKLDKKKLLASLVPTSKTTD
jgi:predicted GH43/DUF377 family glycosyl hydrolase